MYERGYFINKGGNIMIKKRQGFTLTELLTTIAIIAVIATITTVGFVTYINTSRNSRADAEATQIKKIIENLKITKQIYCIGSLDGGESLSLISLKEGVFLAVNSKDVYKTICRKSELSPTVLSNDLQTLGGKLIFKPAKNFSIDFEGYTLFLADLIYISADGIEKEVELNPLPAIELKANIEIDMIFNKIIDLIENKFSVQIGSSPSPNAYSNEEVTFVVIKDPRDQLYSLKIYDSRGEYFHQKIKLKNKSFDDFLGEFYFNTRDQFIQYTTTDDISRTIRIEEINQGKRSGAD